MPLSLMQEIENYKKETFPKVSKDITETLVKATDEMVKAGLDKQALKTGDKIPIFELKNIHGETMSSKDVLQKGPMVMSFYRGGWCPFCSMELRALQKAQDAIQANRATLLAISPELPEVSLKTVQKDNLSFQVLCDTNNQVARSFGLVYELMKELANLYILAFDLNLTKINGTDKFELPIPATYVVDRTGVIRHSYIDVDYTRRMEPADVVQALKNVN